MSKRSNEYFCISFQVLQVYQVLEVVVTELKL
jgi:hypothetical protein